MTQSEHGHEHGRGAAGVFWAAFDLVAFGLVVSGLVAFVLVVAEMLHHQQAAGLLVAAAEQATREAAPAE